MLVYLTLNLRASDVQMYTFPYHWVYVKKLYVSLSFQVPLSLLASRKTLFCRHVASQAKGLSCDLSQVNYYPSAVAKKDRPAPKEDVTVSKEPVSGVRVRSDYPKEQDEFRQPAERYKSFDDARCASMRGFVLHQSGCLLVGTQLVFEKADAGIPGAWEMYLGDEMVKTS